MPTRSMFALASSLILAVLVPARALACTCAVTVFTQSDPKNHAQSVALDAAPYLQGAFDASTLELQDERGTSVDFTLQQGPRVGCQGAWAELQPKRALQPNTRYTIRVEPLYPDSFPPSERTHTLTFTTGDGPLPEQHLEPPRLAHASVVYAALYCGGTSVSMCIGGLGEPMPKDIEVIARRDDQVLLRVIGGLVDDGLYGLDDVPTCVELRRRAANGRRSEPITICGAALGARDPRPSDYQSMVLQCRDGVIGGPSATPAGAGAVDDAGADDAGANDAGQGAPPDAGAAPPLTAAAPAKLSREVSGCSALGGSTGSAATAGWLAALAYLSRRLRRKFR
jgi:hypothetical protein